MQWAPPLTFVFFPLCFPPWQSVTSHSLFLSPVTQFFLILLCKLLCPAPLNTKEPKSSVLSPLFTLADLSGWFSLHRLNLYVDDFSLYPALISLLNSFITYWVFLPKCHVSKLHILKDGTHQLSSPAFSLISILTLTTCSFSVSHPSN